MIITHEERRVYEELKSKFPSETVITWETLRLESAALGTAGTIPFAVNADNSKIAQANTENRLPKTDKFCVTRIGAFVYKTPSGQIRGSQRLRTFPNAAIFTGANEALNMQTFWNGAMNIVVDKYEYYPALDMAQFYRANDMAENLALQVEAGIGAANINYYSADFWPDNWHGFIESIPTFIMSGQGQNDLEINLPESVALAGTSSSNYAVVMFRGFQIQNVNTM